MHHIHVWYRLAVALLTVVTVMSHAPDAAADDEKSQAVALIKEANAHTEAGEHRPALMKYKAAFDIMEDPRILYRIGLSYEQLGNYQRAREHLELYLFADPNSEYKERIEKKIALLKEKEETLQARIEITSNPAGAQIFVDGENNKAYGKTPITLPVGPGDHTIIVRKGKAEQTLQLTLAEGETKRESVDLGPDALLAADESVEPPAEEVVTTTSGGGQPVAAPTGVTQVDIAPPTFLLAIGWTLITVSSAMFFVSGFGLGNDPIAYTIAAASLLGGGYILWFGADAYTKHLDRIGVDGPAAESSRVWGAAYQWTF
jgi:tetratricopeptide (TPR) repeat protein